MFISVSPVVRARIVSEYLTQNVQFSAKCETFNSTPQMRWKMRACDTAVRKFAVYMTSVIMHIK
jgi:hypothetical protein